MCPVPPSNSEGKETMMRLDRSKPYGKLSGDLFIPEGCAIPAAFEQNGKFFDAHGRLIAPGVDPDADDSDDAPVSGMTVRELIEQGEAMPTRALKAAARQVLGDQCPNGKSAIIDALRAIEKQHDERMKAEAPSPAKAAQPVSNGALGKPELTAWAEGRKEFLFADIRKAIKAVYGRNVSERDDAVEFLVGQGLVYAERARKDVIRTPGAGTAPDAKDEE